MGEYSDQVLKHYEVQDEVALNLLYLAQKLCPGTWVLQILCNLDLSNGKHEMIFQVSVSNGDDNVTSSNKNLGAALAQLVYRLLDGSVFPLTGGMGVYVHPADWGWTKEPIEKKGEK